MKWNDSVADDCLMSKAKFFVPVGTKNVCFNKPIQDRKSLSHLYGTMKVVSASNACGDSYILNQ